jgi:hypothetical protein
MLRFCLLEIYMKSLYLRSFVAMLCALSVSACGSGGGNLLLGGAVVGLDRAGLILQNKGGADLVIDAGASTFVFPEYISSDQEFDVTIKASPSSAECKIANGKGKSGSYNVTSIVVTCTTFTHSLGGTVTGLNGGSITLVNGSDSLTLTPATVGYPKFTMPAKIPDGAPFGISILAQPTNGRTCYLMPPTGVGIMGATDITNVDITCI